MSQDLTEGFVCSNLSDDLSGLSFKEIKLSEMSESFVKINIKAASLNFPDLLMSQGKYQNKPELPFALGMEGSGVISEIGSKVETYKIGDEVMFGGWGHGAIAKSIVVAESMISPKPEAYSFEEAAAFKTAYLTAYVGLIRRGQLQRGETLLVHGASGGVGMAAVQLGKLYGARVIATGTSDEKLEVVKSWGADEVLNIYENEKVNFKDRVKDLTNGMGADVIYDPVGGEVFDQSIRCINWGGRLLIIGFAGGTIPILPVNYPLIKGFSVVGVRAGEFGRRAPILGKENIDIINSLADDNKIRPHICKVFDYKESKQALEYLENRKLIGKVVISIN
ncbi:MAG: NADPH:quinone oxidoreductase family protein [Gammaproteobacteria bacterium]|tara:strand:+ start:398 stop:1405 length:1008 start_codon:yes stop_codon:yes gene_type:complete